MEGAYIYMMLRSRLHSSVSVFLPLHQLLDLVCAALLGSQKARKMEEDEQDEKLLIWVYSILACDVGATLSSHT